MKLFFSLVALLFWPTCLAHLSSVAGAASARLHPKAAIAARPAAHLGLPQRSGQAIVQLRDLKLPQPQVQGQATLPMQYLANSRSFTVNLTVGGQTGKFVLDTGASTTLVSSKWVQQLGLKGEAIPREKFDLAMAGDDCPALSADLHRLPPLAIAELRVAELRALEFSKAIMPEGISGILGMNFLSHFDLKVNPQRLQLNLLPKTALSSAPTAIPLQSKLGVMLAKVNVNGQGPFTFLLDTGADSVFISQGVAKQLKLDAVPREALKVLGFCGLEAAERLTLNQVELGQHRQANLEGIILSSPMLSQMQVDGILGQEFFNHYQQNWQFSGVGSPQGKGSLLLTPIF
ncbi:MAG: retroviral-like aspartic protease family protein [Aphanocapsa sp. GSE-SYN-MK-11-07L]|jgi:predicted aspartyl protease|nr:retroviral-like aspartic protease family protein [Aphanocapsa sp. GSE-SYN-MK-11-07L]